MQDFLTKDPLTPKDDDVDDIMRRKALDERRMEEQKEFYEIARKRAAELDVYMEQYANPMSHLFPTLLIVILDFARTLWSETA